MSKELVCPFCNKKLEPIGTSGQFQCGTWGCDASFNFIATRDVWEYIDRTRKALDVAVDVLKELKPQKAKGGGYWAVKSADAIKLINTTIKQITTPEQKDVK
jgi:hypothetical protein